VDIIAYAMKMEKDGKEYYEKHAAEIDDPEMEKILKELAEEEQRHFEVFRRLRENPVDISGGAKLKGSDTLKNVKNLFEKMAANKERKPYGENAISVWRKALDTEIESEEFYKEKAAEETDPAKKELLLRIAKEENNHKQMIDSVMIYMKDPQTFVDSSEYKNFRSLEGWDPGKF